MSRLHIDFTNLRLPDAELQSLSAPAAAAIAETRARGERGDIDFFGLTENRELARRCLDWARALPPEIENVVVLGIGGSSLGARAVYAALARPLDPLRPHTPGLPRRLLFADNVDPAGFQAILELCPPERTVYNAISKSGGTVETAAQLLIVIDKIRRTLGEGALRRHLVVTTDPTAGALRRVATELHLDSFDIPPPVGGRFSVLSSVGLVPAAAAGLDVHGLLDGARAMRARVEDERDILANPALRLAAALHLHDRRHHRPIHVVMPYADGLWETALWFEQLWAESVGKQGLGPTPLPARGVTDQHSLLQLFMEGPDDKVFLFLNVAERGTDVPIPPSVGGADWSYLHGHTLGELIDAERRGTTAALTRAGRPNATITLERLDAPSLGEVIMLLEATTAFAGPFYGVDPYDQPGVEEGKKIAFALLGRQGYEKYKPQA